MAKKLQATDVMQPSRTEDETESAKERRREKENKMEMASAAVEKKTVPSPTKKPPKRSSEPVEGGSKEEVKEQKGAAGKKNLKSPSTPKTPSPGPNKKSPNRPSTEPMKTSKENSGKKVLSKKKTTKRPSTEHHNDESASSSPPKTDAVKDAVKETSSTQGSWLSNRPTFSKKEFQVLEDHVTKLTNFHGFICREDVATLLKSSGDWLVRLSVQPLKEEEKKKKNGNKSKSKERLSKDTKESTASIKVFVISVHCKGKTMIQGKSNFRNMVIKMSEGKVSIDAVKWFKTPAELFTHYQKSSAVFKEGEFQLTNPIGLSSWEFHHNDVELLEKKLGEGAFGDVRAGRMTTKDSKDSRKTSTVVDVAVKMLKNTAECVTRDQVEELLHEARVMRCLNHPNVLKTYGISVVREPLYLMTELCFHGALREYLKEHQKTITLTDKLNFVLGSARGVEYLHSQKMLHRDLAVRNILLTEDRTPKVSDFGLAKLTDRYEMKEHCKIPVRYLAPETLEMYVFTPKTDVFSFGCVIWEIYENGQQPHDGKNAQTIRALVKKRDFLKLSPSAPESLRIFVAEKVFVADPENRCSMTSIVQCLEKVEKSTSTKT